MAAWNSDIRAFRPDEAGVVVAGVAVVAAHAEPGGEVAVVRGDQPPSPATIGLVGVRLKTSASPNPPIGRPLLVAPMACAASNTTGSPAAAASFSTASGPQGAPNTWVAMRALAPSRAASAWARSIWNWRDRTRRTAASAVPGHAWAEAEKVKLGSTTGPGRPSTRACTTSIRPDVQELTATTWSTLSRSATRSSSSRTSAPLVSCPLS